MTHVWHLCVAGILFFAGVGALVGSVGLLKEVFVGDVWEEDAAIAKMLICCLAMGFAAFSLFLLSGSYMAAFEPENVFRKSYDVHYEVR